VTHHQTWPIISRTELTEYDRRAIGHHYGQRGMATVRTCRGHVQYHGTKCLPDLAEAYDRGEAQPHTHGAWIYIRATNPQEGERPMTTQEIVHMRGTVPLQLVGEDGNAFAIIGRFQKAAKSAGWTQDEIAQVRTDMTSADYQHLLDVATQVAGHWTDA